MNAGPQPSTLSPWLTLGLGHVLGALGRVGVVLLLLQGFLLLDTPFVRELVYHRLDTCLEPGLWLLVSGTAVGFTVSIRSSEQRRTFARVGVGIAAVALCVIAATLFLHNEFLGYGGYFELTASLKWTVLRDAYIAPYWVLLATAGCLAFRTFLAGRTPRAHESATRDRALARTTLGLVVLGLILGTREAMAAMYWDLGIYPPGDYERLEPTLNWANPWIPWVASALFTLGLVARIRGGRNRVWRHSGVLLSVGIGAVSVVVTTYYLSVQLFVWDWF